MWTTRAASASDRTTHEAVATAWYFKNATFVWIMSHTVEPRCRVGTAWLSESGTLIFLLYNATACPAKPNRLGARPAIS